MKIAAFRKFDLIYITRIMKIYIKTSFYFQFLFENFFRVQN